jgi:hypothetical protein
MIRTACFDTPRPGDTESPAKNYFAATGETTRQHRRDAWATGSIAS